VLDERCAAIGRDPAEIRRSIEAVCVVAETDAGADAAYSSAARRYGGEGWGLDAGGFVGTPARIVERVHELAEQGFSLFVFFCHDRASERTLHLLAEQVMSQL
jgi:alkanesulfonate monooxygenase SsuD/methylene tetrahydromethanopterin reductase-like flavin-dependent oxidoreductase (luciferase family)